MRALKSRNGVALALFALLMIHGATIGATDDEAYYWVLAQKPALGYAFHPPAVAWVIAAVQALFGGVAHSFWARVALLRLPSAAGTGLILWLALGWLDRVSGKREVTSAPLLVSFAGLFALGWMMVPDIPLFVGWMIAFAATWEIAFAETARPRDYAMLVLGTALAALSKYSAVLAAPSVFVCLLASPREGRRAKGFGALCLGGAIAAFPVLMWNARHEWASILYQIRDRHGAMDVSATRYLRFWLIEFVAAGPVVVAFFFRLMFKNLRPWDLAREGTARVYAFCAIWALPPAFVFGIQPLFFGDFKPHWIFIAWWPAMLALGYAWRRKIGWHRAMVAQTAYGLSLAAVALFACHVPLAGWLRGTTADVKMDPTNDLYGWQDLKPWFEAMHAPPYAVVGSRYQTASQAAFALGDPERVTMIPRDLKARDEWPNLSVSDSVGPDWPRLTMPVIFVADNRYDAGPDFRDARCEKLGRYQADRDGFPAKSIDAWMCEPSGARP